MARNFKISIHISIMALFVFLLSLIGFTIIGINYLAFNKLLNNSAKDLIAKTSLYVSERFQAYLDPLNHNLIEIRNAIRNDIINSDKEKLFEQFLFETIQGNPNMFMIHYGAANGDFFNINREEKRGLQLIHTVNSKPPFVNIRYELDNQGKIIKKNRQLFPMIQGTVLGTKKLCATKNQYGPTHINFICLVKNPVLLLLLRYMIKIII